MPELVEYAGSRNQCSSCKLKLDLDLSNETCRLMAAIVSRHTDCPYKKCIRKDCDCITCFVEHFHKLAKKGFSI